MIIVDDALALRALAGQLRHDDHPIATTWGFHYRLVRAVTDERAGRLTVSTDPMVRGAVTDPPRDRLVVLDPRESTAVAATLAVRHGLNLLAAELVGAAVVHAANVQLSVGNVGVRWPAVFAAEGVRFEIVTPPT